MSRWELDREYDVLDRDGDTAVDLSIANLCDAERGRIDALCADANALPVALDQVERLTLQRVEDGKLMGVAADAINRAADTIEQLRGELEAAEARCADAELQRDVFRTQAELRAEEVAVLQARVTNLEDGNRELWRQRDAAVLMAKKAEPPSETASRWVGAVELQRLVEALTAENGRLIKAAADLYDFGHWTADRGYASEQEVLWERLREAIGRPAGTSPRRAVWR